MPTYDYTALPNGKCPCCSRGYEKHSPAGANVSSAVELAVAELARREHVADAMAGAVIAKTTNGNEFKLVAASGTNNVSGNHNGFDAANEPPTPLTGLLTIHGKPISTSSINLANPYKPCAAIKLLHGLALIARTKNIRWASVSMYEEQFAKKALNGKTDTHGREKPTYAWTGHNYRAGTGSQFGADSCKDCMARIPVMFCDKA